MKQFTALLIVLTQVVSFGCSAIMAVSGTTAPDVNSIRPGVPKSLIDLQLGSPIHVTQEESGSLAWYTYQIKNEPSAARAMGHIFMDIMTLGAWEIVGVPIEAMTPKTKWLGIQYDRSKKVVRAFSAKGRPDISLTKDKPSTKKASVNEDRPSVPKGKQDRRNEGQRVSEKSRPEQAEVPALEWVNKRF